MSDVAERAGDPSVARFRAIALDGGTTNTRARLVHDGRVVATARREVGCAIRC